MVTNLRLILASVVMAGLAPAGTGQAAPMAGPVEARVIEVVDGDTIRVAARIWLGQDVETLVRIAGIDAPELHGRCARERQMAVAARDLLARRLGGSVVLTGIANGKYAGRVVAHVALPQGPDLAALLLEAKLARPYDGGTRQPWCPHDG
jgi:endonuclease YncB( thermonuclease family)